MDKSEHYILAGWLIDGSGGPIQKKVLLKLVDGTIADISRYNGSDCPSPSRTTDLSHCCLLPPLIDSHAHLCMSGTLHPKSRQEQLTAEYEDLKGLISEHLSYHLSHGVLAVRDGGDRHCSVIRYHRELDEDDALPVVVKSPGKAWYREGRYGGLIGRAAGASTSLDRLIAEDTADADHIKVINSGVNSLKIFGHQTTPQFSQRELTDTVAYAKNQGLKVMVHANGILPVQNAIEAGCYSIEHGYFMGQENLEGLAEKQIFWVPTLYAMKGCLDSVELGMKDADPDVVARNLEHQTQQLAYARECGVRVAVGTDAGSIGVLHGESLIGELKLFIRAGYSLPEAIRCATHHGAHLLGIEDQFGLIGRGRPAHFLVARGTPAQLPRKLSFLEAIYLNGKPSDDYRHLLRKARVHRP